MIRGERLIKYRYIWFSVKSIKVEHSIKNLGRGKALFLRGGSQDSTEVGKI